MFTQTSRTLPGAILLFTLGSLFISNHVLSQPQNFHPAIKSVKGMNVMLDSMALQHLEVNISQPDKNNMKFRIAVANPVSRYITIVIKKQNDIYFSEVISMASYENIYDLNQLEDGDYQVQITGGKEKILKNIIIHTETKVQRQAFLD